VSSYRVSWRSIKPLLSLVIGDLMQFQNGGRPPTGILIFFKLRVQFTESMSIIVQTFVAIGQTVAEIWLFLDFRTGGRPPCWIFKNRILSRVG